MAGLVATSRDFLARAGLCGLIFYSASVHAFECMIEPWQIVDIASPVTGLVEKINVKRADRVGKGQVLATLESKAEQATADIANFKSEQVGPTQLAEQKIEFSKRKFVRRQALAQERLLAPQDSDDAESELRLAEAELKVAHENRQLAKLEYQQQTGLLGLRTLRSPFDGVVVEQMAYPGEVVEPGSNKKAILKLAQLDPLKIHALLPKEYFGRVSVGMPGEVIPEVLMPKGKPLAARVKAVDRLIDAASGTFVVLLEVSNSKLEIPAGLKCQVELDGLNSQPSRKK